MVRGTRAFRQQGVFELELSCQIPSRDEFARHKPTATSDGGSKCRLRAHMASPRRGSDGYTDIFPLPRMQ